MSEHSAESGRLGRGPTCECPPCPGRGNDGHGLTHCAECCFGSGVVADCECPQHGKTRVTPPDVPRDHAPRNYAEQRALLDNSLQDIAPYPDEVQAAEPVAWWRLGEEGSDAQTS